MNEAEVVEQLIEFTNILLVAVSLIFSVVSAYIVALNYFIGSANFIARLGSFLFITLILGMFVTTMMGTEAAHAGLIARLRELEAEGQLTAAGRALLSNDAALFRGAITDTGYSIDSLIALGTWVGLGFVYLALAYLTFLHRWTPDAIPVQITERPRP